MKISEAIREASETTGLMKRGGDHERYNGGIYYAVEGFDEIRRVSRWGVEKWEPKAEELMAVDWETAEMVPYWWYDRERAWKAEAIRKLEKDRQSQRKWNWTGVILSILVSAAVAVYVTLKCSFWR